MSPTQFRKARLASTESVTKVRIFGETRLTIHYFDYTPNSQQMLERASAQRQEALTPSP